MNKKELEKLFLKAMTRHCKKCGAELPRYNFYRSDGAEIVKCPGCGHTYEVKQ